MCYAILLDEPSDGFHRFQTSRRVNLVALGVFHNFSGYGMAFAQHPAAFAHIVSNGIGTSGGSGVEIDVEGHQKISGPHGRCTRTGIKGGWSEIGLPTWIGEPLRQSFIFTRTTSGQVFSFGNECSTFVAKHRNGKLFADTFGKFASIFNRFFHADVRNRNQRTHICCTHPRMLAFMALHVYYGGGFFDRLKSGFDHLIGRTHKSYHRAVGGCSRINVEQFNALYFFNFIGYLLDKGHIAAFAKVGNTFDEFFHFPDILLLVIT